jgi:Fe-S-cluster containining protein
MDFREFSNQLQSLYTEMSQTFSDFQKQTQLPCLNNCTSCCLNPEIEATPFEMIPMAVKILDEGRLEEIYEKLENPDTSSCVMVQKNKCEFYDQRPPICRMFGVAGFYKKDQSMTLSICKLIKEENKDLLERLMKDIPTNAPVMSHWITRLKSIDPNMDQERQPINNALKSALERVALWDTIIKISNT